LARISATRSGSSGAPKDENRVVRGISGRRRAGGFHPVGLTLERKKTRNEQIFQAALSRSASTFG
jgi:hypothetical protein